MRLIPAQAIILTMIDSEKFMCDLEYAARTCYKSKPSGDSKKAGEFISGLIAVGHESVIEHISISVMFICDRGVSHEIVRHRIASYTQESTRYCNYSDEKFGHSLTFIIPFFYKDRPDEYRLWAQTMSYIEAYYFRLLEAGSSPQEARSILPNSLKTELIVTMNLREWRHFFKLRTSPKAHPQMRELTVPLLKKMKENLPYIFGDIRAD